MQKLFYEGLKNNIVKSRNLLSKNFSTLIVPEISNGKIHGSILNLTKAATQLDNDVIFYFKFLDSYSYLWRKCE